MAQTITTAEPMNVTRLATGRYLDTGTVAAYTFTTGFQPRYVKVQNLAATGATIEYYEGMADASAWKSAVAGDGSLITTLGITVSASGFIFGLDLDANVTSEQVSWIAIG
jgi:hypothetical protein